MTDFIKEKLIKSIIEADLIINEINKNDLNNKILYTSIIIILFIVFWMLLIKYISKSSINKKKVIEK